MLQSRTVVPEYLHEKAYCPTCRRAVFQTAQDELRNCAIGPTAKATAVYLRHELSSQSAKASAELHADYSRGSDVATHIFGTRFGGYLNADSYAAYNVINPKGRRWSPHSSFPSS